LNPQSVAADRDGRAFEVDLSAFSGRQVELLFSTDPGPSSNSAWDWAGWAALRFTAPGQTNQPGFKEVYRGEVFVYGVSAVLPRAAVFRAAEILPDGEVLARLKADSFDPERTVVLSRESLSELDPNVVHSLATAPPARVTSARISSYESQRVR